MKFISKTVPNLKKAKKCSNAIFVFSLHLDKERDVESMTNRIRHELHDEIAKRQLLLNEIESLKSQLEESKAGLLAAARISDQLEIAQVTNATIKEECKYRFVIRNDSKYVFASFGLSVFLWMKLIKNKLESIYFRHCVQLTNKQKVWFQKNIGI